jgi:hypothetical protein
MKESLRLEGLANSRPGVRGVKVEVVARKLKADMIK